MNGYMECDRIWGSRLFAGEYDLAIAIARGLETRAARGQYPEECVFGLIRCSYLIARRSYIPQQVHRIFIA